MQLRTQHTQIAECVSHLGMRLCRDAWLRSFVVAVAIAYCRLALTLSPTRYIKLETHSVAFDLLVGHSIVSPPSDQQVHIPQHGHTAQIQITEHSC